MTTATATTLPRTPLVRPSTICAAAATLAYVLAVVAGERIDAEQPLLVVAVAMATLGFVAAYVDGRIHR